MNKRKLMINSLAIFIGMLMLVGCTSNKGNSSSGASQLPETQGPVESKPSDASTPIIVKLTLSKAPRLNEQAELAFIISSVRDAPSIKATLILPDGTNLISGDQEWSGALKANESHTIKATIMFVTGGNKTIEAKALYALDNGDVWGDAAYLYLNTTEESGQVGFSSQQNPSSSSAQETPPSITPTDP